jgi:hypothetical protein
MCSKSKGFTRAIVEMVHNECDLIIRDGLEALRLWEVLAQQPIHVYPPVLPVAYGKTCARQYYCPILTHAKINLLCSRDWISLFTLPSIILIPSHPIFDNFSKGKLQFSTSVL